MTSFFSFYEAFQRRLVLRGWGSSEGMSWAKKRKKRLIRLQVFPYRTFLTGIIIPVSLSL
jgi:hypothetical protein